MEASGTSEFKHEEPGASYSDDAHKPKSARLNSGVLNNQAHSGIRFARLFRALGLAVLFTSFHRLDSLVIKHQALLRPGIGIVGAHAGTC